jgi:hypothetical protein
LVYAILKATISQDARTDLLEILDTNRRPKYCRSLMATFHIEDSIDATNSVDAELVFNPNPLGTNDWRVISGSGTVLPVDHGTWESEGVSNVVLLRDDSNVQIGELDRINVAVSLTDPFQNLNAGDSGGGLLTNGGIFTWTLLSK